MGDTDLGSDDQVNQTLFRWIVGTTKDLTFSNQFAIAVWSAGAFVTDSATNIFNITSRVAATNPGQTSATVSSSPGPTMTVPAPPQSPPPSTSGLSAGASAGVGIGAAFGIMALAAAVWFLVRRRRRQEEGPTAGGFVDNFQNPVVVHDMDSKELGLSYERAETPKSVERHELPTGRYSRS